MSLLLTTTPPLTTTSASAQNPAMTGLENLRSDGSVENCGAALPRPDRSRNEPHLAARDAPACRAPLGAELSSWDPLPATPAEPDPVNAVPLCREPVGV